MRRILVAILISFCVIQFLSCKDKKSSAYKTDTSSFNFLSGYWIPKDIKWGGDDSNIKDTGDIYRIAGFETLCFDTPSKFTFFSSTQRRPINYDDSIIFAGEPIVKMFRGNWSVDDSLINVSYKVVPEGSTVADSIASHKKIKIIYSVKDTMLFFENNVYLRTKKYDKASLATIESYKQSR
jgi:hypothetical protein